MAASQSLHPFFCFRDPVNKLGIGDAGGVGGFNLCGSGLGGGAAFNWGRRASWNMTGCYHACLN